MSTARASAWVAERRRHYAEAYAGDDVYDVLGIDLYHPLTHPADGADLALLGFELRVLAEEARARGKPHALTEAGTLRLNLLELARTAPVGAPLHLHGKDSVAKARSMLFDPADRAALLRHYELAQDDAIALTARQRARAFPRSTEDWFGQQLLVLAREASVAYALVWHTYFDGRTNDGGLYYFVPYPEHGEARSFERFYAHSATCFLRDRCALAPAIADSD
jgi:hypothetical protein